ncbi:MAG: exo-alpha-sialidase [Planctomycetes bacterium]|nr:exo-alpha-sialidase [Planctomycetota bacterium]
MNCLPSSNVRPSYLNRSVALAIALTALLSSLVPRAAAVAKEEAKPQTIEQTRITVTGHEFNRPDPFPGQGNFSWPGNMVRLPDGELLLVHSAGYYHVSFAQPRLIEPALRKRWLTDGWPLDFAAPTGGRSMLVRSRDGGRTWSKPRTLIDLPLDDAPYGLLRCDDGTLLCFINVQASWYGYAEAPPAFHKDIDGLNTQQCVVRSIDDGRSWSNPIWLDSPGNFYERSHAQPLLLPSGRILWPTYYSKKADSRLYGALHASDDEGRTWSVASRITRSGETADTAGEDSGNIDEPAVTQLPDGRLFLITRPDGGYFFSEDEGANWTFGGRLVTTGKFKAPRLFVLADGTVVCICTYRNLQVFLGRDGGKSWTGPIDLDPTSYGYPGGLQLEDDSMLISYCSSGRAPNRVHLLRFRVDASRTRIELLPVDNDLRPPK